MLGLPQDIPNFAPLVCSSDCLSVMIPNKYLIGPFCWIYPIQIGKRYIPSTKKSEKSTFNRVKLLAKGLAKREDIWYILKKDYVNDIIFLFQGVFNGKKEKIESVS